MNISHWNTSWRAWIFLLLAGFAVLALCNAWVADDAYITLRVSDNFLQGHGLRWNVAERVQVFTHPMWMMVLTAAHFVTGEAYFSTVFVSWVISVACAGLVILVLAESPRGAVAALVAMMMSKAFMDFSSSGLENPLTHLLLAGFCAAWFGPPEGRRRAPALGALAGLLVFNRLDTILLVAPALALEIARSRKRISTLAWFIAGMLPVAAWLLFSTAYYGFPLPNTMLAKTNLAVSKKALLLNGWYYVFHSLMFDRITLALIAVTGIAVAVTRRWREAPLLAGAVFYPLYVVWVGGDFMSGRFFAAPFLLAVIVLSRLNLEILPRRTWLMFLGTLLVAGFANRRPTVCIGTQFATAAEVMAHDAYRGVHDERSWYYTKTAFLPGLGRSRWPDWVWRDLGERLAKQPPPVIKEFPSVGLLGYFGGPGVHVVDTLALCDPLLARLRFAGVHRADSLTRTGWGGHLSPGHYERPVPVGYVDTLQSGEIQIADPSLHEYYDRLHLVISGPLWTRERWRAILDFNLGRLQPLLDAYENPDGPPRSP